MAKKKSRTQGRNAKTKAQQKQSKREIKTTGFSLSDYIPEKYQIPALAGVLLLLFLIFYSPIYFGNETFQSGDIVTSKSLENYIEKERDGYSLWAPYIFCGMPAYGLSVEFPWFNFIQSITYTGREIFAAVFSVEYSKWSFHLFLLGITMFLLLRELTRNNLVAFFGGASAAFCTGYVRSFYIGHVTKLVSLSVFPLVLLMLFRLKKKITLLDSVLLVIATLLMLQGFHVQIIFYGFLFIAVFFIYYLIHHWLKKQKDELMRLVKTGVIFAGAVVASLAMQSPNITQIYEYTDYSTRGTESILDITTGSVKTQAGSEYYSYHTSWSFSPEEIATFVVPSFYGWGKSVYEGPLTNNQPVEVNTYFGQMEFVDTAGYFGVIVFFFALFSVYVNRDKAVVKFAAILGALALLLSFGKNFPLVFDLFFNYFPFFNKFRAPEMILVLVYFSAFILAGMGIYKLIEIKKKNITKYKNLVKYLAYGFTGALALSVILSGALSEWFAGRVSDYAASMQATNPRYAQQYTALSEYMTQMFTSDLYFAFGFTAAAFWLAFGYLENKLTRDLAFAGIAVLSIVDLIRIDSRGAIYKEAEDISSLFNNKPAYVELIEQQNDEEPFRLLNMKQDGSLGSVSSNANYNVYWLLEDFYGYSAIKPRAYQDYIDVIGTPFNQTLLRLANVKYLVFEGPVNFDGYKLAGSVEKTFVYENQNVLPRLYLADTVEQKESIDVLNAVKNNSFDPKKKAFVQESGITVNKPDSTAFVKLNVYKEREITAEVNATGSNFLVLSNTYMPVGWHAYIDGEETRIHRTFHAYMGVVVPDGKHKVEFIYMPVSFAITKNLSLALNILVAAALFYALFLEWKKRRSNSETEEKTEEVSD